MMLYLALRWLMAEATLFLEVVERKPVVTPRVSEWCGHCEHHAAYHWRGVGLCDKNLGARHCQCTAFLPTPGSATGVETRIRATGFVDTAEKCKNAKCGHLRKHHHVVRIDELLAGETTCICHGASITGDVCECHGFESGWDRADSGSY